MFKQPRFCKRAGKDAHLYQNQGILANIFVLLLSLEMGGGLDMATDIDTKKAPGAQVLSGLSELQAGACRMAAGARQRIFIYDWQLDRSVYDQECLVEAVKQLVIRHANTHVRILLADTEPLRLGGYRMLELARRLPSAIEIRLRAEQFAGDLRSFMLVDDAGYVYCPVWHDLNASIAEDGNRYRVRELAAEFTRAWEQSAEDPGLRQLPI